MEDVTKQMSKGGFTLHSVQLSEIEPPENVLLAMNEMNAAERRKIAAKSDG